MSDKYIIRNCPCFNNERFIEDYLEDGNNYCPYKEIKCQDCTDCVMKQIVKITKNYNKGYGKHCDINRKENNCGKTCNAYKIRQILELLDIEDVE